MSGYSVEGGHSRTAAATAWAGLALIAAGLMVANVAGCGQSSAGGQGGSGGPGGTAGMGGPAGPMEVGVLTVTPRNVALTHDLPGRTAAFRLAEVRPRVGGVILKRLFTEGTDVEANQPLYEIDSRRYAAELDRANANVTRAQAEYDNAASELRRLTNLKEEGVLAEKEYLDAVYAEQAARGALDLAWSDQCLAALNLEWTEVVAPIAGRIGHSSVTEGALVTAEQPTALATIQQIDQLYVDVTQSSNDLLRLRRAVSRGEIQTNQAGQARVKLLLEDGTEYSEEGTLQFADVTVNISTSSVTLRAIFGNPKSDLLPGMFVRARLVEGQKQDAILIPQLAVSRNSKGEATTHVVSDKGLVELRVLEINRAIGNQWLVNSGLKPGEQVIVNNLQVIREGMPVKAVPADLASAYRPDTASP